MDLSPGTVIALNLQINNLGELRDRQTNFTQAIKLPPSAKNYANLGLPQTPQSQSVKPYRLLDANYIENGTELPGYAVIEGSGPEGIELVLYFGNIDFFKEIEGKKLRDLDLSAYNHTWNFATVTGAGRTNTDGFLYPVIDYNGMDVSNRTVNPNRLAMAMYAATLWNKIHEAAGFNWDGKIKTSPEFLSLLSPFSNEGLTYPEDFINDQLFNVGKTADVALSYPATYDGTQTYKTRGSLSPDHTLIYDDETSPGFFDNPGANNITTGEVVIPVAGSYTFSVNQKISIQINDPAEPPTINVTQGFHNLAVQVYKNGTFVQGFTLSVPTNNITSVHTISGTTPATSCQAGDLITYILKADSAFNFHDGAGPPTYNQNPTTVDVIVRASGSYAKNSLANNIIYGGYIQAAQMLPDMTQKDFIKGIANYFALIPSTDRVTGLVSWVQFKELYENIPLAKDMSDKLDVERRPSLDYRIGNYAQINRLKYKDDDTVPDSLGVGEILVDDHTLEEAKDLFTLPFAASETLKRLNDLDVVYIDKINGNDWKNKTAPRLIMLDRVTLTDGDLTYDDGTSSAAYSTVPLTYFVKNNGLYNMSFGDSVLDRHYLELSYVLDKSKKIVLKFNLTAADIKKINLFTPWYLKPYANYFYVNRVSNYVEGKLTSVELIRL